jgi:hypothetical protein
MNITKTIWELMITVIGVNEGGFIGWDERGKWLRVV